MKKTPSTRKDHRQLACGYPICPCSPQQPPRSGARPRRTAELVELEAAAGLRAAGPERRRRRRDARGPAEFGRMRQTSVSLWFFSAFLPEALCRLLRCWELSRGLNELLLRRRASAGPRRAAPGTPARRSGAWAISFRALSARGGEGSF